MQQCSFCGTPIDHATAEAAAAATNRISRACSDASHPDRNWVAHPFATPSPEP